MPRPDLPASRRRWRLRNNVLWLLATLLGAAAVVHTAAIIHNSGQRRVVRELLAGAVAEHLVTRASARLEVAALQALAPAALAAPPAPAAPPAAVVAALARAQREGERCRCRALLPATAFFHLDLATGALAVARVDGAPDEAAPAASGTPLDPALLAAVARGEAARAPGGGARASAVHLALDPRLGTQAVVSAVQPDARGNAAAVSGLVGDARALLRSVLPLAPAPGAPGGPPNEPVPDAQPDAPPDGALGDVRAALAEPLGSARLDTLSVLVADPGGRPVLGALDPARGARATVHPRGALAGLTVAVALAPARTALPLAAVASREQLWGTGALLLAAVMATVVAVGSTRREALLARARSDFIASVSHDLRMPLAQILLASETLTLPREPERRERQALASSVLREARRLVSLVENVLLFSRAGAVELRARPEPVPVGELLEDVLEAVQLAAADAEQTIEVHVGEPHEAPREAPLVVLGDRRLLRQALVNLVDNALKYGAPGQRVRLGAVAEPGGRVRLTVDDEGPGIPAAERALVFEPYERLGRDQDSERTGTGLGLAVVRHVARACDGRAWLEDAPPPPGGTRAVLELRAAAPAPNAPTSAAEPAAR